LAGYVGLNNGNGRGSMDSIWSQSCTLDGGDCGSIMWSDYGIKFGNINITVSIFGFIGLKNDNGWGSWIHGGQKMIYKEED